MAEILFVTWDGGGNVPPALGIATELQRRGHRVRFLGHPTQQQQLTGAGFAFRGFPTAPPFDCLEKNAPPRLIALFTDRAMGRDVVAESGRTATDVVVVDCLLIGALRACADAKLPYVTLEHLFDGYLRGAWLHGPIGIVARLKGLRPVRSWDAARLTLVASLAELDPGHARPGPESRVWTGPVLAAPATHDLGSHDPAVLVSLSTTSYPGMQASMQRVLDATAGIGCRVLVTTGPAIDPSSLRAADNHEIHRFVPHDEVMPVMSLVVGHGGHATTMRALAHDLPMVIMPMHPMLDQPMVGREVARAGAGVVVGRKTPPTRLRPVIEGMLAGGAHRVAAARLGAQIRASRGTVTAADRVLDLVGDGVVHA